MANVVSATRTVSVGDHGRDNHCWLPTVAGIDLLASRPDIDAKRTGLRGHSEGGIIASIAAVRAPSKVAFIVAEDTVAGFVRDQDVFRVSHQIRQAGFTDAQLERAMDQYN